LRAIEYDVLLLLIIASVATHAIADDGASREEFDRSFVVGCQQGILESAVRDYAKLSGIESSSISPKVREEIRLVVAPVFPSCLCLRDKAAAQSGRKPETGAGFSVEFLARSKECAPDVETLANIRRRWQRLMQKAPLAQTQGESERQFRMAVIVATRTFKRYPKEAAQQGLQGKASIRVSVNEYGKIMSCELKVSTGHEILDTAALDMVKNAAASAQIPNALRGKEFAVDIPVSFVR